LLSDAIRETNLAGPGVLIADHTLRARPADPTAAIGATGLTGAGGGTTLALRGAYLLWLAGATDAAAKVVSTLPTVAFRRAAIVQMTHPPRGARSAGTPAAVVPTGIEARLNGPAVPGATLHVVTDLAYRPVAVARRDTAIRDVQEQTLQTVRCAGVHRAEVRIVTHQNHIADAGTVHTLFVPGTGILVITGRPLFQRRVRTPGDRVTQYRCAWLSVVTVQGVPWHTLAFDAAFLQRAHAAVITRGIVVGQPQPAVPRQRVAQVLAAVCVLRVATNHHRVGIEHTHVRRFLGVANQVAVAQIPVVQRKAVCVRTALTGVQAGQTDPLTVTDSPRDARVLKVRVGYGPHAQQSAGLSRPCAQARGPVTEVRRAVVLVVAHHWNSQTQPAGTDISQGAQVPILAILALTGFRHVETVPGEGIAGIHGTLVAVVADLVQALAVPATDTHVVVGTRVSIVTGSTDLRDGIEHAIAVGWITGIRRAGVAIVTYHRAGHHTGTGLTYPRQSAGVSVFTGFALVCRAGNAQPRAGHTDEDVAGIVGARDHRIGIQDAGSVDADGYAIALVSVIDTVLVILAPLVAGMSLHIAQSKGAQ